MASRVWLDLLVVVTSRTVRVAFVGNSYTFYNDLPSLFAELCDSVSITVEHASVTPPGSSLYEKADFSLDIGKDTRQMLQDPRGWDFVVLQEQSQFAGGGKNRAADLGPGEAKERTLASLQDVYVPLLEQANATAVLYATWGRANGDPRNSECCGYHDFASMTRLTAEGIDDYAGALAPRPVLTAPAGKAFGLIEAAGGSRFCCLYTSTKTESGCTINAEGVGGHPSLLGSYLVACVLYGTIFDESPEQLTWAPSGLSFQDADAARTAAYAAVSQVTSGRRLALQQRCPEDGPRVLGLPVTLWVILLSATVVGCAALCACAICWRRRASRGLKLGSSSQPAVKLGA